MLYSPKTSSITSSCLGSSEYIMPHSIQSIAVPLESAMKAAVSFGPVLTEKEVKMNMPLGISHNF